MKTTKLLICAVAVVAAYTAATAQGQTLTATLDSITPGLSVNGTFDGGGYVHDLASGVLDFGDFEAFCAEPLGNLAYGDTVIYQIQDPSSLANYDTIARLVGGYLSAPQSDPQTAAEHAAAVQWAIWEVIGESSPTRSLSTGDVRISTPVNQSTVDLANTYLANVANFSPATITYLTSNTHQDIVAWNVVPEPASAGLAALSGLILLRRRRKA